MVTQCLEFFFRTLNVYIIFKYAIRKNLLESHFLKVCFSFFSDHAQTSVHHILAELQLI